MTASDTRTTAPATRFLIFGSLDISLPIKVFPVEELLVQVVSMVDKLSKKNIIHKNKAGHLKSQLTKHVAGL